MKECGREDCEPPARCRCCLERDTADWSRAASGSCLKNRAAESPDEVGRVKEARTTNSVRLIAAGLTSPRKRTENACAEGVPPRNTSRRNRALGQRRMVTNHPIPSLGLGEIARMAA